MMKKFFQDKEEVFKGSLILFVMMNIFNFLNYVFHFSMARLLSPANYGILAVLMSIVYIFGIPAEGIQTIVSRYTSRFNIKNENGKIKFLMIRALKKIVAIALLLFLFYIPLSLFLSYATKIKSSLIIFTGLLLFGVLLIPVTRGVLQGKKKFKALGWNMILESIFKLGLAIIFVFLGFEVYGAIGAVIIGVLISFLLSFLSLKQIANAKIIKEKIQGIYAYSWPVFLAILIIMMLASLDIIFAKIYFPEDLAGKYAVASMLGKMIFFGTFGIVKAMFPLSSEMYDKGGKSKTIFKKSFFIMILACFISVICFLLFPKLIISILFGSKYLEISNILFFIGLAYSFISLTNLSLVYALSTHRKKIFLFLIFVILEIIAFTIFHSSLKEFSLALLATSFLTFVSSISFISKQKSRENKRGR